MASRRGSRSERGDSVPAATENSSDTRIYLAGIALGATYSGTLT